MDWLTWLRDLAEHNQFFSGIAGASAIGGVLYWVRSLPARAWDGVVWLASIQIEVGNDNMLFMPIEHWLAGRVAWHTRILKVVAHGGDTTYRPGHDDDEDHATPINWYLAPGRGSHWIRHDGWLYRVRREVTNEAHTNGARVRETLYIRTLGWSRARLVKLLDDARVSLATRDTLMVYIRTGLYWIMLDRRRPRPLDTLVLRAGLIETLVADVETFRAREDWYIEHGVPYRRGYLFVGGPGGGKSSTAVALAGHFGLPVYVLNLGSLHDDDGLIAAVSQVPSQSVLLIEDIDATGAAAVREPDADTSKEKLSLSALLNCIDGPIAREGRILIMTSNHPERIDPALTRKGRVDMTFEFPVANAAEAGRLFARFFPEAPHLAAVVAKRYQRPRSAAEIQDLCLTHLEDPAAAATALTGPAANGEYRPAAPDLRLGA